jgi:Winged helix-turn-helix DNA-binding
VPLDTPKQYRRANYTPNFSKCLRPGAVEPSPRFTRCALDGLAIMSPIASRFDGQAMISNFQNRIVAMLQESPNGLTSNEIAERFGTTVERLSSRLSKLAAYGIIEARPVFRLMRLKLTFSLREEAG